jgi:hypothetical protein
MVLQGKNVIIEMSQQGLLRKNQKKDAKIVILHIINRNISVSCLSHQFRIQVNANTTDRVNESFSLHIDHPPFDLVENLLIRAQVLDEVVSPCL